MKSRRPLNNMKECLSGTKPIDGGYYILTEEEKNIFLKKEPNAKKYLHPYIGTTEFLIISYPNKPEYNSPPSEVI